VGDAGKKIGEGADLRRQMQRAIAGLVQQLGRQRFGARGFGRAFGEQRRNLFTQCRTRAGTQRHQIIQRSRTRRTRGFFSIAGKQFRLAGGLEIEHLIADGNTAARRITFAAENAQRQILYRKIAVPIRAGNPALALDVMRFVDLDCHGRLLVSI
jgi:hypothetical protein